MNRWYDCTLFGIIHHVAALHPFHRKTLMKRVAACSLLLLLLLISMATPVWAYLTAGSGGILDTQTGLVWLPITATEWMTVEQVQAATLPGRVFYGYQFATTSEMQGLFLDSFGVTNGTVGLNAGLTFEALFGYDWYQDLAAPFDNGQLDLSEPLCPNSVMGLAEVVVAGTPRRHLCFHVYQWNQRFECR